MDQLPKLIHIVAVIIFLALTGGASDTLLDWTLYRSKSVQWELCRLVATVTPLIAIVLMVIKRPA